MGEIAPIGRDERSGGYLRYAFTEPELRLREWFREQADARAMPVTGDGNGNLFAWWGDPDAGGAVLTGSHFDSVPHGGAYDGPLGIVSAWLAVDELRAAGVTPSRPLVVGAFVEEEGARFGVPCLGSRLLTGQIDADRAGRLRDAAGVSFAEALGARPTGPIRGCSAGSAPSWSCTSSRAARSSIRTRRSRWQARSGRTAAGVSISPARATTPVRPGWPTAATRCSRTRSRCWRPTRRPGYATPTPLWVGWWWSRTRRTRCRRG
ncbi:hypothetical protein GCM10029963_34330 [Micromonospora andamanensis]